MPRITAFQPTPNPNALKCVLESPLDGPIRSFRSAADAAADPLGRSLFAVPGITSVLISGPWLTVNKSPQAAWPAIKKAVEQAVANA